MQTSINFAKRLNPDYVTFGIVVPAYGTKFYSYLEKNGYMHNIDGNKWDPNNPPVYNYPDLSSDEIYKTAMRGYREFYLNHRYILKRLYNIIKSPKTITRDLSIFKVFMKRYVIEPLNFSKGL